MQHREILDENKSKHTVEMSYCQSSEHQTVHTDLHEVVYPSQQLCVDGQSAVQLVSRGGDQSHGELSLEHQHGTPEQTQSSTCSMPGPHPNVFRPQT